LGIQYIQSTFTTLEWLFLRIFVFYTVYHRYQYLLIAAEPYETVAFKIPNEPIDREVGKFLTSWNEDTKRFNITLHFVDAS